MKKRMEPQVRKDRILEAALHVAEDVGFHKMTRLLISAQAQVSVGLVNHYFSTMAKLRRAVMRAAVRREILPIIAYGLVVEDKQALKAPKELKDRALRTEGK